MNRDRMNELSYLFEFRVASTSDKVTHQFVEATCETCHVD